MIKIEHQPEITQPQHFNRDQRFPTGNVTLVGQSQMQNHLNNLETLLVKIESDAQSVNQYRSLNSIPSLPLGLESRKPNSMVLETLGSNLIPSFGLSQMANRAPILSLGSLFPNQMMRNEPVQGKLLSNELQNQMAQINLLNNLASRQQTQALSSLNTANIGQNSIGLNGQMRNPQPIGFAGNAKNFGPQSLEKILPVASSMTDLVTKIGTFGSMQSYQDINLTKSTAFSESSSPKHARLISANSPGGTYPSLHELPEPNSTDLYPSMTSLDEEIKDEGVKPSMSINSQYETLGTLDRDDALSLNSYASITKGIKSFSLPDIGGEFKIKIEERGENRPIRYGESSVPGIYSKEVRALKILKYKKKIIKWRVSHPVNRAFSGRSVVAGAKPRIRGKFVSHEEYAKYMEKAKSSPGGSQGKESDGKHFSGIKIEECL